MQWHAVSDFSKKKYLSEEFFFAIIKCNRSMYCKCDAHVAVAPNELITVFNQFFLKMTATSAPTTRALELRRAAAEQQWRSLLNARRHGVHCWSCP